MDKVHFLGECDSSLISRIVIVAHYNQKWVFCKNNDNNEYNCPFSLRNNSEDLQQLAKNILHEKTSATSFSIVKVCAYSISDEEDNKTYGMLFSAQINEFEELTEYEIDKLKLFDVVPKELTKQDIQSKLIRKELEFNLAQ